MKWAHIINISILFDCTPNKSHCSNKQRAPLLCLPLSGWKLLTLHLTIYYRHLSQVTDKHCDGCMILLCQNGFISSLQATISTELMSWAYSLSSDFLSFPRPLFPSHMVTTMSLILHSTHSTRNKCILLFTDLLIYALCLASPMLSVFLPVFTCVCFAFVHMRWQQLSWAEAHDFPPRAVSHCYSTLSMQYPAIWKPNYQSSQLLLANFKALSTCCSFSHY